MTIKDIAKEAGYSVGTVSRVLNNHPDVSDKARKKVMAVVKKNHFKLNNNAKHLKQQSNSGIAVIVKGNNNMLFATIVEKLQGLIKEREDREKGNGKAVRQNGRGACASAYFQAAGQRKTGAGGADRRAGQARYRDGSAGP